MIASNLNELFGVLRSMLSARHLDAHWSRALYRLLEVAYQADAERYWAQWVPYLQGDARLMSAPLETWFSVEDYRTAALLAPFGCFELVLEESIEPEDIAPWAKEGTPWEVPTSLERLSQVRALTLRLGGASRLEFKRSRSWTWPEFLICERLPVAQLHELEELRFDQECELEGWLLNALMALEPQGLPKLSRLYIWSESCAQLQCGVIESLNQPILEQLRALIIRAPVSVEPSELERLFKRASLTRLEALGLSYTMLGDEGVRALFGQESTLHGLRQLDLSGCELTASSLPVLAQAPMMRVLEDLDLLNNQVGACVELLLDPALDDVQHLYLTRLSQQERDDEGPLPCSHLAATLTGRQFTLSAEVLDGPSLVSCLQARQPKLLTLSLAHIALTLKELDALLDQPGLSALEHLMFVLPDDPEQHEGYVRRLAAHTAPWRTLSLDGREALSPSAQAVLEAHPAFAQLEALGANLTTLNTSRWGALKRLACFGELDVASAQTLVEGFGQLQWLWAYADGETTRHHMASAARVQDALRASGCGAQCVYVC